MKGREKLEEVNLVGSIKDIQVTVSILIGKEENLLRYILWTFRFLKWTEVNCVVG